MNRRLFLRRSGAVLAGAPLVMGQAGKGSAISLVIDPSDAVASSGPAQWAARELEQALTAAGYVIHRHERVQQAGAGEFCIVASGNTKLATGPESLSIVATRVAGRQALVASGSDPRGLVYALLELADRARLAPEGLSKAVAERPANPVRSVMRQFTSEPLDKPWYYDREMWPRYLGMLAGHRFNRLHLAFGLGYDALQQVADSYFLFLYPYLVAVPGYKVRVANLPDAERDRNLEMLRFISEQTVACGMEFELGVWMHGYRYTNSPIEGLTAETHAPYCRDALTTVLKACPAISSVGLRIHGESGIAEGSYDFWKTVFDGVPRSGRKIEIDLHAKGIDATMIDNALATGMPVNLAPKYWAEHLGMPYHQAAIRDLEMPVAGHSGAGLMTLSEGARVFTRYGYADLMRDDRKYTVRHRVFSGTQRLLMSGDAGWSAGWSRMFRFCGSTGADVMEPLTCRGRRGTGIAGTTRSGYIDARLEPHWDWEKYSYWYRTWGRLMYNPDSDPDVWHREFGHGAKAKALESALGHASRILPIVTTAHMPSAACDAYWPEVYWNQPMMAEERPNPYGDSPAPKTFQHASPLDPQMFSGMDEFARELLSGQRTGKYSPIEVAQWLEDLAGAAEKDLASAETGRLAIDVEMQAGLGQFFAAKFRSGVLYAIYEHSGDQKAAEAALKFYSQARAQWAGVADRAKGIYAPDLSASDKFSERGQWLDRLPAMDKDISVMALKAASAKAMSEPGVAAAIAAASGRPARATAACKHQAPAGFRPKQALAIEISVASKLASARMYYRHVNQAERYESAEMELKNGAHHAAIPASYTDSPYPLQYYFELKEAPDRAWIYPGFAADLANLPYIVLRRLPIHNGAPA